jgi:hypothetical protein
MHVGTEEILKVNRIRRLLVTSLRSGGDLSRLGSRDRSLVELGGRSDEGGDRLVARSQVGRDGRRITLGGRGVDMRVGGVPLLDLGGGCGVDGGSDGADGAVGDRGRAGGDGEVLGGVKSGCRVARSVRSRRVVSSTRTRNNLSLGNGAESG